MRSCFRRPSSRRSFRSGCAPARASSAAVAARRPSTSGRYEPCSTKPLGPSDATARFAPEKIERVLLNLLTNALRHTPTDGSVAVVVDRGDHEVCVRVEDTGEGVDEEGVERMFERFWRGDRARSTPGAGLGLAIARGLVEAHGGRIWAERRSGGGTSVSFTLPA